MGCVSVWIRRHFFEQYLPQSNKCDFLVSRKIGIWDSHIEAAKQGGNSVVLKTIMKKLKV